MGLGGFFFFPFLFPFIFLAPFAIFDWLHPPRGWTHADTMV
jgi:hypothetical protein